MFQSCRFWLCSRLVLFTDGRPDTEGADVTAVAVNDVATLDKVLVGLRVIETPDDGPDGGDRRVDGLDHDGSALVGMHVRVVTCRGIWYLRKTFLG